jgi:hypothetical protein
MTRGLGLANAVVGESRKRRRSNAICVNSALGFRHTEYRAGPAPCVPYGDGVANSRVVAVISDDIARIFPIGVEGSTTIYKSIC